MTARFYGSIPALVTPFRDGAVDFATFEAFVDWQIAEGSTGLVPCGTTGESATMTIEEHNAVIAACIKAANGRVPVIAGCGSNDTACAVSHVRHAEKAGADAALVVSPYYNKPNQEGLYQHFKAVAEATGLPIILYNIPGRSVVDIAPATMKRLSEIPNIVGVKDATGVLQRISEQRLSCGADFIQLSGNDDMTLGIMASGGHGCISVTANVAPRLCADFQAACLEKRWDDALVLQDRLYPLHAGLFSDASPGPAKYALSKLGKLREELRLPMVPAGEAARRIVDAAMAHAGIA
ncbi:4-hydroxy-tetrahydrodipicolinate synthase [Sphingosinicella microcystinivorans]|uniref:4-hydroxy-tetrahydrodipicolinate synthase n=1 Tax=Sphingosinicella microcystinivorans TaxID=335406 RepID=UPI0022F3F388|nr:4-hydroxy-tetrahydrodipicolinate synthase [Sphingosinicella microcystinivorans]WBX83914.1 4-hydroxy-tetrahydrodipicolinate synthase [Sphingosinicella microcystinivorans]